MSPARLVFSVLFLILATALGLDWVFRHGGVTFDQVLSAGRSTHLPPASALAIFSLSVGIYFIDAFRYQAFARAFGVRLPLGKSLRATTGCLLFSWISPYGMLGPPAGAFLLNQDGSSWEEALLISYGKSLTGALLLLAASSAFIALGYLPSGASSHSSLFLFACLGFYVLLLFTPPMRARLRTLARAGFSPLVLISVSHVLYFAAWISICALWARALGAPPRFDTAVISGLFVTLLYMSPTPSGAGVAELTAVSFFGTIMSPANALLLVVLFRVSTYGAQIVFGALYFLIHGGGHLAALVRGDRVENREPR